MDRDDQDLAQTTRFAGVLIQRIVHDLAGAAGALEGATELAASDPAMTSDALEVARESAAALTARLRLLRAAWMIGDEPINAISLRSMLTGLPGAERLTVRLRELVGTVPLPRVPAFLLAVMVAAESLPRGGTIDVTGDAADGVAIDIAGRDAAWPARLAALLGDAAAIRAALPTAEPRGMTALSCAAVIHRDGVRARFAQGAAPATLLLDWAPPQTDD